MFKKILTSLAAVALTFGVAADPAAAKADKTVYIGWTAWSDAEVVSKMASIILNEGMGYDVELTLSDISQQYRGVADGNLDAMLMSWQPLTHADYMQKYGGRLVDAGILYSGAKLGWVVPAYVPEDVVSSVADLAKPDVREKLDNTIEGIDPGAGLTAMSKEAIKAYGLDGYELKTTSGPRMAMQVGKAVRKSEWVVGTAWNPHWMFAENDLRYLDDPKGVFGDAEEVHVIVRQDLKQDMPDVFGFLSRFHMNIGQVEAVMADARNTSHREAIYTFLRENRPLVDYWMTGENKPLN